MKDTTDWNDIEILPRTLGLADASADTRERRELIIMHAGAHKIGVYADEADSVTDNLQSVPLPHAPPAVLGVVSVRGRMRTVLDPVALLEDVHTHREARYVVALRGDEQLALAVERVESIVEILTENIQPLKHAALVVRGVIQHDSSTIVLLDPSRLFEAAMQGTERRRQRS